MSNVNIFFLCLLIFFTISITWINFTAEHINLYLMYLCWYLIYRSDTYLGIPSGVVVAVNCFWSSLKNCVYLSPQLWSQSIIDFTWKLNQGRTSTYTEILLQREIQRFLLLFVIRRTTETCETVHITCSCFVYKYLRYVFPLLSQKVPFCCRFIGAYKNEWIF